MAPGTTVTVSRQSLQSDLDPTPAITEVKNLASYSWIEARTPTIAVPGIPPQWVPSKIPRQLPKDSGYVYVAQNAARHPESPLEPLFRALYKTNPEFSISSIDVVSDRNNIRKLFSFVDPSSCTYGLESFTIEVEATKNTVILSRAEVVTREFIGPNDFRGYGHEFEKSHTTCKIKDSTGHHRISSYRFSNLNFIIRYEVDAYVEGSSGKASGSRELDPDVLSSALDSLSVSSSSNVGKATRIPGSRMAIRSEGQVVPPDSILEIKTRAARKPLFLNDVAVQLWVSQTPKLVRAHHRAGRFEEPEVEDVRSRIRSWECENQRALGKLAALIRKIISTVKGFDSRKGVIKYDSIRDTLKITEVNRAPFLPMDLYSKWNDQK
ncbi:hypothetical protein F4810DRAFT_718268 [Camillea tinctor]|nr:hypothetical protein F4810DRAFT_718268 [Camillea tinctor]